MTIFFFLAVVAGTADLPAAEERPVEGAATPMRDVIAAAFDAPFVTDTEIDILIADDNAWVISEGGPTLFRYRRIWAVQVAGAKDQPIVIRPQTPSGVTFRRDTRLTLRGKWIELRGVQFEHCGPDISLFLSAASDCRVTQCQFFGCGSSQRTFRHIVSVDMGSHRNRIDHCYFTGSKSMSFGQRIRAEGEPGTGNRYDHSLFRDIYRDWIDGGHVYGHLDRNWVCLDLETGEERWSDRGIGRGSIIWADGMLPLFSERRGEAALAICTPDGFGLRGQFRVDGRGNSWAHPVVSGGRLYLRYDTTLYCFDVRSPGAGH